MDKLPKTLLMLMNTVIEEYNEMSWTSLEQTGKMKITLIWTNDDMPRNKSKATRKRDRKRYEQFKERKEVVMDENAKISENNNSRISSDEQSECEINDANNNMEIVDTEIPSSASSQVNLKVRNENEGRSIKKTKEFSVADDQVCNQASRNVTKNKIVSEQYKLTDNLKHANEKRETPLIDKPKRQRRYFKKIVTKTTGGLRDTLLGKMPYKDFVIVHSISKNKTWLVGPPDGREWEHYSKNVDDDFRDVQETEFMNDQIEDSIRKMELFIEARKLHTF